MRPCEEIKPEIVRFAIHSYRGRVEVTEENEDGFWISREISTKSNLNMFDSDGSSEERGLLVGYGTKGTNREVVLRVNFFF